MVRDDNPLRHDPAKLARAVMSLYESRGASPTTATGPSATVDTRHCRRAVQRNRNLEAASELRPKSSVTFNLQDLKVRKEQPSWQ